MRSAEVLTDPVVDVAASVPPPAPEQMLVRHLTVEHLGRWISLPGKPEGRTGAHEPTVASAGGRLVGYRPGDITPQRATRKLVILQGPTPVELAVNVGDLVVVAPREW